MLGQGLTSGQVRGHRRGLLTPHLVQLRQRLRAFFRRSGGQRGLLRQGNALLGGRRVAVVSYERSFDLGHRLLDRRRAGGERGDLTAGDPSQLEDLFPTRLNGGELQAQTVVDVVHDPRVVQLRCGDAVLVDHPPVQGGPPPVNTLHPVGDHQVIVQVRVTVTRVIVSELRGHKALVGVDLLDPTTATTGVDRVVLQVGHDVSDGRLMGGLDAGS